MSKIREVLRLHFSCQLSNRSIARAIKISPSTVGYYLNGFKNSSLSWDECKQLNDKDLIAKLEQSCSQLKAKQSTKAPIDLAYVHNQLKHKGVTRELLWKEYCQDHQSNHFSYTEFCRQYRVFKKCQKPSMRQNHKAGEKVFVDYAGPKVPIINAETGEVREAVIFVGVLGASNYTFVESTWSRSMPDWIGSHVRMYEFFGGVPELTIPDNEKSGVNKACYYDPELNPQYAALAAHYDTVVLPTRPVKPQDKAKVEAAVLVVERWILARIRNMKFFTLDELNQTIAELLNDLNQRQFKKLPGSRLSQFLEFDSAALKPLPAIPYMYADIKKCQVRLDYHIEVDEHYYSVPHQLIGKQVTYHLSTKMIEIFHDGLRIVSHLRSYDAGKSTTLVEHMPHAHRQHQQWTPQQFVDWSITVGDAMKEITHHIVKSKRNPECCYRIHLGFLNLSKRYSKVRLESACQYALKHHLLSFSHIRSILKTQIDQAPVAASNDEEITNPSSPHDHIRGANYYSSLKQQE